MTRDECEREIMAKIEEIIAIYKQYNPDGNYVHMYYANYEENGYAMWGANNSYWSNDADRPMDVWKMERHESEGK